MSERQNTGALSHVLALAPDSKEMPAARTARVRRQSGAVSRLSEDARAALLELSRALVGQMSLKDAQRALRTSMSQEALARCNGSRRAAAALLGVDRRYVQRLAYEGESVELDGEDTEA